MRSARAWFGIVLVVASAHYGWLLFRQTRELDLAAQNRRLQREVLRVRELGRELASLRELNRKLGESLGGRPLAAPGERPVRAPDPLDAWSDLPSTRPVDGPLSRAYARGGWPGGLDHPGLDFAAAPGRPVRASAGGRVSFAERTRTWGFLVIVDHGRGLRSWYGHVSPVGLRIGDSVARGQLIGLVAAGTAERGSHLHYALQRDGDFVDPLPWLERPSQPVRSDT